MYLSQETVKQKLRSSASLLIVGGLFTVVGLYCVIAGLAGNADLRKNLSTYVVMIAMFASVLYLGLFHRSQVKLPRQMAAIFETAQTDSIPVQALSEQLNLPYDKTLEEVRFAIDRRFLLHCRLDESGEAAVVLLGDGTEAD